VVFVGLQGLNTATMSDSRSRASQLTAEIAGFYAAADAGNYSINGVYVDSTQGFGAPILLNFKPQALIDSRQPPVFDTSGGAAVLFAQDYLDFLGNLSDTLHKRGDRLFGNAMYMLPQIQFATAFDIAGIETGWQVQLLTCRLADLLLSSHDVEAICFNFNCFSSRPTGVYLVQLFAAFPTSQPLACRFRNVFALGTHRMVLVTLSRCRERTWRLCARCRRANPICI